MEHAALQRQKPDVVDRQRLALGRVIEVVRHQPQQRQRRRAVLGRECLLLADAGLDVHLSGVARVRDLLIEHGELRLQQRVHLLLRRVRRQRDRAIQRVEVLRRAAVLRGQAEGNPAALEPVEQAGDNLHGVAALGVGNALIRSGGKAVQPQREGSVTDGLPLIAVVEQHAVGARAGHERRALLVAVEIDHAFCLQKTLVELLGTDRARLLLHGEDALKRRVRKRVVLQHRQHIGRAEAVVRADRRPVRRQDAVLQVQDALRQALRENVEAGNRALSCGEIAEWEEHSKQFHKIFYAYAQSPCLDEADAKLRPRLELLSCIYYQSASREKINKKHNEILRLVLDDNFEAAQKLMRAHLECDMLYAIKGYHTYKENL